MHQNSKLVLLTILHKCNGTEDIKNMRNLKLRTQDVNVSSRDTREGWPLLTLETEANGDL